MSAQLAAMEKRLLRGLDADTYDTRHDDAYIALLKQYEALLQETTGTCLRRDHVGAQLAVEDELRTLRGTATAVRLTGVR